MTELLEQILEGPAPSFATPTLADMGITQTLVDRVHAWADQMATYGELATYIPELARVESNRRAIVVKDLVGNTLSLGNGLETRVSIQSVVKPFLYIYALKQGLSPESISSIEATAQRFNTDPILQPESLKTRPGHPLNNAGAISSAGAISDFGDFLNFMRGLVDSPDMDVLVNVFDSEMATNSNNRAIAYRMVSTGRFETLREGEAALEAYTRACSIGIRIEELARAGVVLAAGGLKDGKRVIKQDYVVRALNAMGSYGLYENTGEISLLAAGARALSCKSGVSGFVLNIDPNRGVSCTYGPRLDEAGNSVFGKYALIPLNNVLAAPNAIKLSTEEILKSLEGERRESQGMVPRH